MKLSVSCVILAPLERVWSELKTVRLLHYVAAPMQVFVPVDPPLFPENWHDGIFKARLLAFGWLPMGGHSIVISFPKAIGDTLHLRDNGYGDLIRKWDHLISIAPRADGNTDYQDEVEIEAGLLTIFIWAYAKLFYRHRQRRWQKLVANNFSYGSVN